jgi:hypothetical protein
MEVAAEDTAVDRLGREKVRFWLWSKSIGSLVRGLPVDVPSNQRMLGGHKIIS